MVASVRSGSLNSAGVGLTIAGAVAAIVSIFLPVVQPPAGLISIQSNSLVQSSGTGSGVALRIVLLAVIALALTYRYHRRGRASWGVIVAGGLLLAGAFYDGNNESLTGVYPLDFDGQRILGQGPMTASLGIALYVAGVGGALTIAGGWLMLRHSPTHEPAADAADGTDGVETTPETKSCPDCAETVLAAANVCKHCGYRFDEQAAPDPA